MLQAYPCKFRFVSSEEAYVVDSVAMYVETVRNRSSPPAILLRESYREAGKVKKRTLANLSHWPPEKIEAFRRVLRDEPLVAPEEAFEIIRTLPSGHVAAVLGTLKKLGLDRILAAKRSAERDRVVAMIVARIVDPRSKLATARGLGQDTAFSDLGDRLDLGSVVEEDDLYAAMDWLLERQTSIEKKLSAKHLENGTLVLYDVTSTYFEGRCCPLAKLGYSRDGKKGTLQIVFGLLCSLDGCPIAVEVFEGNTADPSTVANQIEKLRNRFRLDRLVLVGDRGMLTQARIREDIASVEGVGWITALRSPAIKKLLEEGTFNPSLFDERALAEIASPDYPGERLIVCRNPMLAAERARKREDLLQATERELDKIVAATKRSTRPLRGADKIGERVGRVLNRFKVGKHFLRTTTDKSFSYERDTEKIEREAALDGIYIVRTSVDEESLNAEQTVLAYKRLSVAERAFRSMKTIDMHVRPIHHHLADRVRSHVFLCMLAYYVEWHMRRALAPILFDDEEPEAGEASRSSVVAPAQRSPRAKAKAASKMTEDGLPVHSFRTLLMDLATLVKNVVRPKTTDAPPFTVHTTPTAVQARAFQLLGLSPNP